MNKKHSGIIETVEDKSVAAIKGTGKIAETTEHAAANILAKTAKDTAKVGGEVGTAATGLATGAIEDVKKVGVKAERGTAAVAGGAFKAVGKVGTAAVDTVRKPAAKHISSHKTGSKEPEMDASRN